MLIGRLEVLLLKGEITEKEYKERKKKRIEKIQHLYIRGIISTEDFHKMLNA